MKFLAHPKTQLVKKKQRAVAKNSFTDTESAILPTSNKRGCLCVPAAPTQENPIFISVCKTVEMCHHDS